jgi:hypothetical protein
VFDWKKCETIDAEVNYIGKTKESSMKAALFSLCTIFFSMSAFAQPGHDGHLVFSEGKIHAHLSWEHGPDSSGGESKMRLEWHDGATHALIEPGLPFSVSLWMPSMGHGSAPTQIQTVLNAKGDVVIGTYLVTNMYFLMAREVAPEPIPASAPESEKKPKPKNHSITESLKSAISTITRTSAPPKTTVEQIKDKWTELISSISAQNHSLTFILSMVNLTAVDGEGLHLTFPYSLHKEKIEEHKNRKIIEECLAAKFGEPIRLVCALAPSAAPPTPAADAELTGLALEFGGEVVS